MQITNDKYKKALIEIEKVIYGKIKHLNNQARILHIGEILSKVMVDGKFVEDCEEDEDVEVEEECGNEEELQELYKEFYEVYLEASYLSNKVDEIFEKIEKVKKQ
jgi:hypothetical protein